ncbi:MAG: methyltransferase domain-containing protein, partial [Alphaproteobacteria bacterium]
ALRLGERVEDHARRFERVLALGFPDDESLPPAPQLVRGDPAVAALPAEAGDMRVALDDERLPFADRSFDLVLSNMLLHWANDLPGALTEARRVLAPDGLFLAALIGGESLGMLRHALLAAEARMFGRAAPRVIPMLDVRDAGDLMMRAGFALPVVDIERITVRYGRAERLLEDLSRMGEAQALRASPRGLFAKGLWREMIAELEHHRDAGGEIPVVFDILMLAGFAPAPNQPKPLRPGSARIPLADVLGGKRPRNPQE